MMLKYLSLLLTFLVVTSSIGEAKPHLGGPAIKCNSSCVMGIGTSLLPGTGTHLSALPYKVSRKLFCTGTWSAYDIQLYKGQWYVGTSGQVPPEIVAGSSSLYQGMTLEKLDGTISAHATFSGVTAILGTPVTLATSVNMADGDGMYSNPIRSVDGSAFVIPPNTCLYARTAQQIPASGFVITNNAFVINGEGSMSSASDLSALLDGGTITGSSDFSGPFTAVAKGWNGTTPVLIAFGDSIAQEHNDALGNDRGVFGWVRRGIDDNTAGTRYTSIVLAISGTTPVSSNGFNFGAMGARLSMLYSLPNPPYTAVFSEMGVNSVSLGNPAFEDSMKAWWAFLSQATPGVPVVQSGLTPNTGGGSVNGFTSTYGLTKTTTASCTTSTCTSGTVIPISSVTGINVGQFIVASNIPTSKVTAINIPGLTVTISPGLTGNLNSGVTVSFGDMRINSFFSSCNDPAGDARCGTNTRILSNAFRAFSHSMDNTAFWAAWNGANPQNSWWTAPGFTAHLIAATTGSKTISIDDMPGLGDCFVFDVGIGATNENGFTIMSVNGSPPNVQITLDNPPASGPYPIGTVVGTADTDDGVHPCAGASTRVGIAAFGVAKAGHYFER